MVQEDKTNIESLGQFLKREREFRNISIEEIATSTKINVKLLKDLESDNFDALPAPPFIKGYLKSYAQYVGLEIYDVLNRYREILSAKDSSEPGLSPRHAMEDITEPRIKRFKLLYWGAFALILIVIFILSRQVTKTPLQDGTSPESAKEEVSSTGDLSLIQKSEEGGAKSETITQKLLLHTTNAVWMKVQIDDHMVYSDFVLAGRDISLEASSNIKLFLSDSSSVRLTLNDRPVTDLGSAGYPTMIEFKK